MRNIEISFIKNGKTINFLNKTLTDKINQIYDDIFLDENLELILKPSGQFHKMGNFIAMVYDYQETYSGATKEYIPAIQRFRTKVMDEIAKQITGDDTSTAENTFTRNTKADPNHTLFNLKPDVLKHIQQTHNELESHKPLESGASESVKSVSTKNTATRVHNSPDKKEEIDFKNILFALSNYNLEDGRWMPHISLISFAELQNNNPDLYKTLMDTIRDAARSKKNDITGLLDYQIRELVPDSIVSDIINKYLEEQKYPEGDGEGLNLSRYVIHMNDKIKWQPEESSGAKGKSKKQLEPDAPIAPNFKSITDLQQRMAAIEAHKKALADYERKKEKLCH